MENTIAGGYQYQFKYELWLAEAFRALEGLENDPGHETAEDIGDFVECMKTLISFAPRAQPYIQQQARSAAG